MFVLAFLACAPATVADAGDPSILHTFDLEGGRRWSDLVDAGWENAPGRYNVLLAADADPDAVTHDLGVVLPRVGVLQRYSTFGGLLVEASYAEAQDLAAHPDVLSVTPDRFARVTASSSGGCASGSTESRPDGIAAVGSSAYRGGGVNVVVIDTGADLEHPDLEVLGGAGFVEGTSGYEDDHGHGTHVAGTIAALDNSIGVIGVAPEASIYAAKVLDSGGSGTYSAVAAGVDWATANGMDVANMSLGGPSDDEVMHAAVSAAFDAGVVVVVAAGNDADDAADHFPSAYDGEVLTVSAYDVRGRAFAYFSNYGTAVDLAGPGVSVCSTYVGASYASLDGTSMAAPHVAGAVAVYLQHRPGSSFAQVESALERGARSLADTAQHTENLLSLSRL